MEQGWNAEPSRVATLRRVAIVLSSLPDNVSAKILDTMSVQSRDVVHHTMKTLVDVDPLERRLALKAFRQSVRQSPRHVSERSTHAAAAADRQAGLATVSKGDGLSDRASATEASIDSPLGFLADVEDLTLGNLLMGEHPQAIALVLASISPTQAARLLPRLEANLQRDVMLRLGPDGRDTGFRRRRGGRALSRTA